MLVRDAQSARSLRLLARLPRYALISTCVVLSLAGLRAIVRGDEPSAALSPVLSADTDLEAVALAEQFVRTYLEWNGADTAGNLRGLAAGVEPPSVPGAVRQHVRWVAASRLERSGSTVVVTVTAATSRAAYHLAVPIGRRRGVRFVAHEPALVGAAPTTRGPRLALGREVEDRRLAAVARRALTNYLARDHADLVADLDDRAVVVLPDQDARLVAVDELDWVAPGRRIAAAVRVRLVDRVELPLRYELAVVRRAGRWLVRAINTNPTTEVHP